MGTVNEHWKLALEMRTGHCKWALEMAPEMGPACDRGVWALRTGAIFPPVKGGGLIDYNEYESGKRV